MQVILPELPSKSKITLQAYSVLLLVLGRPCDVNPTVRVFLYVLTGTTGWSHAGAPVKRGSKEIVMVDPAVPACVYSHTLQTPKQWSSDLCWA